MKSGVYAIIGILLGVFLCVAGYHTISGAVSFGNTLTGVTQSITPIFVLFGIGVIASLLGFAGIILEKHDKKIAAIQYLICGIFVLIGGLFIFGGIPAIFFIVAAYIAYQEGIQERKQVIEKESMIQCPYCQSLVPNGAAKCKFCTEWINKKEEK
ncbi:MAG: hypothetical protein FWC41_09330 [Firmicutes bacterium]|nr:hypothetical protein [Bacillota bacterium]